MNRVDNPHIRYDLKALFIFIGGSQVSLGGGGGLFRSFVRSLMVGGLFRPAPLLPLSPPYPPSRPPGSFLYHTRLAHNLLLCYLISDPSR